MSNTEGDALLACLESRQDGKLNNVKFFRGADEIITAQEFTREFCDSLERSRKNDAEGAAFPKCRKAPIDVREFVQNI